MANAKKLVVLTPKTHTALKVCAAKNNMEIGELADTIIARVLKDAFFLRSIFIPVEQKGGK